jgi:hypothetical protein
MLAAARQSATAADAALQNARALLKREQYLDARDAVKNVNDKIQAQMQALNEAQKARAGRKRD